ncbi:Zn(II)2Cys6 transcription factor [Phanerochaete sordida]|uniref:Zn(II)2Cys6 transcription factor n=1 Tax=Phanerochaete sordida TaxID=48140 RepID=A0A9P3L9T8_9APHY|nr:Zn(II)2Cys6 transcription factor [Phanerochaete sordida]
MAPPQKRRDAAAAAANDAPGQPYSKAVAKELRRTRGEIACAECRRLKVRCNRQVPCETCITRGCAALCPNGILPPGDNSRFVSAAKDHLQKKISSLQERMRALEDALAIAQSAESDETHPLLREQFILDDEGDLAEEHGEDEAGPSDAAPATAETLADSFGTLHIDPRGKTLRFYGPSGGAESLLDDEHLGAPPLAPDDNNVDLRALGLPAELEPFYHAFPLAPAGIPARRARTLIEAYRPPWARAVQLGRTMLDNLSWMFQIVTFQQFAELLPAVYALPGAPAAGPHDLALFFGVLTMGALADLALPPYNAQAQLYYVLCRCSLALESPMAKASLATVKTFHFISLYNGMSGKESNMSNTYTVLTFAGRLAQKIGLHIDPAHWKMSPKEAYDRRIYFWNLVLGDIWQSLGTGRPSGLVNAFGHVRIPTEEEEQQYQAREYATLGFGVWCWHILEELMLPVMKLVLSAKSPSYRDVWELDAKIRAYKFPDEHASMDSPSLALSMSWFVRSHYRELILLSLHRSFFAKAMALNPQNPLSTPYAQSFLTVYHCAWRVAETTLHVWPRNQRLMSRIWMIWSFNFAAAIIIGAVASRCRNLPVAPPPLAALAECCRLFAEGAPANPRAAKALPLLLRMRERAVQLHRGSAEAPAPVGRPRLAVATPAHPHSQPAVSTAPGYADHDARYAPPYAPPHQQPQPHLQPHPHLPPQPRHHQPQDPPTPVSGTHFAAEELWDARQQPQGYAYEGASVDFDLGDAWVAFMQSVGIPLH